MFTFSLFSYLRPAFRQHLSFNAVGPAEVAGSGANEAPQLVDVAATHISEQRSSGFFFVFFYSLTLSFKPSDLFGRCSGAHFTYFSLVTSACMEPERSRRDVRRAEPSRINERLSGDAPIKRQLPRMREQTRPQHAKWK